LRTLITYLFKTYFNVALPSTSMSRQIYLPFKSPDTIMYAFLISLKHVLTPLISYISFDHSFIHSFLHQWFYSPLLGLDLFFNFVIFFTQTVRLLGRVISPSQGRYLHTEQDKHRTNAHTDIHGPSARASKDSSCPRPRGYCDRHIISSP
jgi:hypothetical protein